MLQNRIFFLEKARNVEDTYWMTKLLCACGEICFIDAQIVMYRINRPGCLSYRYLRRLQNTADIYRALDQEVCANNAKNSQFIRSYFAGLFLHEIICSACLLAKEDRKDMERIIDDNRDIIWHISSVSTSPKRMMLKYSLLLLGTPLSIYLIRMLKDPISVS